MESFEGCPLKWKLHYIDGEQENDTWYSNYGSLMHEIIDMYYKGTLKQDEMVMYFLSSFRNRVVGRPPKPDTITEYITCGVSYLSEFKPLPFKMIETEKEIDFSMGGMNFVGIIDFIGETGDGIVIIDHKSRKLKPRSNRKKPTKTDLELDEMERQLYLYSEWVRQKYGAPPVQIGFNCFRNQQLIVEDFSPDKFEEAKSWACNTINGIADEEDFDGDYEWFKCAYLCGYSDRCEEYQDAMEEFR